MFKKLATEGKQFLAYLLEESKPYIERLREDNKKVVEEEAKKSPDNSKKN